MALMSNVFVNVFVNGLRDQSSIPGHVIPKTQKWYLIRPCLTLQGKDQG